MTLRLTFAIDPGLTGAVATLIDGVPGPVLDMPTRERGKWTELDVRPLVVWIRWMREQHPGAYVSACVEHVGAMPTDGATSAFRFGENFGALRAALDVLAIPYVLVQPVVWKRHFGLLKHEAKKDAGRLFALEYFPSLLHQLRLKKHHGRADAVLLALWHDQVAA